MLKNILSQFFIKSIFDYIIEGKKLELIKYNKRFQNILSISLYNYKLLSQRYIIYEENNKITKLLLGIGDWGLGIGDWGLGPIPNPQSPIPNPQSPFK